MSPSEMVFVHSNPQKVTVHLNETDGKRSRHPLFEVGNWETSSGVCRGL